MASNRLKEICFPDQFSQGKFDVTKEVHDLNREMSRSSLGGATAPMPPPTGSAQRTWTQDSLPSINDSDVPFHGRPPSPLERTSTLDRIAAMEVTGVKPERLTEGGRSNTTNTIDEFGEFDLYDDTINLDDVDDTLLRPGRLERMTTDDFVMADMIMNDKSRASPAVGGGGGGASSSRGPSRPSTLAATDRMTTTDILEIMNQEVL